LNDITNLFGTAARLLTTVTNQGLKVIGGNLNVFIQRHKSGQLSVYEASQWIASLEALAAKVSDLQSRKLIIPQLLVALEDPTLKSKEPASWILGMHDALNLTRHPDPTLSELMRSALAATQDADISAYVVMNDSFRYVRSYQTRFMDPRAWPGID
jgi:hypothetical protein